MNGLTKDDLHIFLQLVHKELQIEKTISNSSVLLLSKERIKIGNRKVTQYAMLHNKIQAMIDNYCDHKTT